MRPLQDGGGGVAGAAEDAQISSVHRGRGENRTAAMLRRRKAPPESEIETKEVGSGLAMEASDLVHEVSEAAEQGGCRGRRRR